MIRNIYIVFKKEFLQLLRDKSVLFTNFFIPFFGLPLYLLVIFELTSYVVHKKMEPLTDATVFKISYQGEIPARFEEQLNKDKKIKIVKKAGSFSEETIVRYRKSFQKYVEFKKNNKPLKDRLKLSRKNLKEIDIGKKKIIADLKKNKLYIEKDFDVNKTHAHMAFFKNNNQFWATYVFFSNESSISKNARKYLKDLLDKYERSYREKLIKKKGITAGQLDPISFWDVNLDEASGKMMQVVGVAVGGWLLFMLIIGIFNPSINTTLGERDGQTYKVLLMNPIGMTEIFLGKYLNIAFQGLMTLVPYFIQGSIFYIWGVSNYFIPRIPLFTPLNILIFIFSTMTVAICISAFCFLLSSFAKSRQQAQSIMSLAILCIMIPIGAIGIAKINLSMGVAFLPMVNFPLMVENLMLQTPNYSALLTANIVNLVFSIILIWLSLNAFEVQWKGKNDTRSVSDLISFKRKKVSGLIPAHAFLAFCVAALGYLYGGVIIQVFKVPFFQFLLTPLLFSLGVAVFIIYNSQLDFTKVLKWENLWRKSTVGIIFGAVFAAIIINYSFKLLLPVEWMSSQFPTLFEDFSLASMIGSAIIFALIPGFCEEVLFRGVIFQGLRKQYNLLISAVISSIFFAVIHFSIFRWGHTFLLGLALAYIYEKRGLLSCIIFHIVFNFTVVLISFN